MLVRKVLGLLLLLTLAQYAHAASLKGISATVTGNSGEEYTNLFDGLTSTKWCGSFSSTFNVVFSTVNEDAISISGYKIATANDDASYTGRRPKVWRLEGSNDKSSWTTLDSRDNSSGSLIAAQNQTYYTFTLDQPTAAYKYFRLVIVSIMSGSTFQMSEVDLIVANCSHLSTTIVKTGDCASSDGSVVSTVCSLCGATISVSDPCYTHVPHLVDGLEDGTCEKCTAILCMVDGVMEIDNLPKWNAFANSVNNGNYTLNARLTADITGVTNIVGPYEDHAYKGTFDGQGHTMGVQLVADRVNFALFCYTNGATIKNLHLTGTIDGCTFQAVAGLVGYASGHTVIQQVWNSVNITSTRNDDGTYAGFVALNNAAKSSVHNTKIEDCLFDGSIVGAGIYANAGIAGYIRSSSLATITNCLVVANMQTATNDCATITRNTANNAVTITNCYYKSTLSSYGTANGTLASDYDLSCGATAYLLNGSTDGGVWGQTIGTDAYPVPIVTASQKVYYHVDGENSYYSNSSAACEHNFVKGTTVEPTCATEGYDTYTCSNCHMSKKENVVPAVPSMHVDNGFGICSICGNNTPATIITDESDPHYGYYQIASPGNLKYFADLVNASADNLGLNAVVVADIDMTILGDWTPIAYDGLNSESGNGYTGTFDGGNFTLSNMTIKKAKHYVGLFSRVSGGTIKNVKLKNVNINTSGNNIGVLAGICSNDATVTDCHVLSGSVQNNYSYMAGFISAVRKSKISRCMVNTDMNVSSTCVGGLFYDVSESTVSNCCYTGKFQNVSTFGGLAYNSSGATFDTCYVYISTLAGNDSYGVLTYTSYSKDNRPTKFNNCVVYMAGCTRKFQYNNSTTVVSGTLILTDDDMCAFGDGRVALYLGGCWGQDVASGEKQPVIDGARYEYYIGELEPGTKKFTSVNWYNNMLSSYTFTTDENVLTITNDVRMSVYTNVIMASLGGNATAKTLNITDGTPFGYGNSTITAEDATFTRTISNDNLQSLVLPFDVNLTTMLTAGYNAFYVINNVLMYDDDQDGTFDRTNLEVLRLTNPSSILRGGYPYIVSGQGEHVVSMDNNPVFNPAATTIDCSNVVNKYSFVPTFLGVSGQDMYDNHYLAMASGKLALAEDNTVSLSPFRWYLDITSRNASQVYLPSPTVKEMTITVVGEDSATGIIMYDDNRRETINATYDLMGRRVANGNHGLRIVNGKKIMFK